MKDIYIIAAHTPDKQRDDILRDLVRSLKKQNRDTLLISHTNTPQDIIDDVKYYFYDCENKLIDDTEILGWIYVHTNDFKVWSKYFAEPYYILGAYRLFLNGLTISKILGYNIAHYIEYDSFIKSVEIFDNNVKRLTEYDAVVYDYPNNNNQSMIGHSFSLNIDRYSFDDIKYDEKEILSDFLRNGKPMVEALTYSKYIKDRNHIHVNIDELTNCVDIDKFKSNSNVGFLLTPAIFSDNFISVFTWFKNTEEVVDIMIVIDKSRVINIESKQYTWSITPIDNVDNIKSIDVYAYNKLYKSFDMSTSDKLSEIIKNVEIER